MIFHTWCESLYNFTRNGFYVWLISFTSALLRFCCCVFVWFVAIVVVLFPLSLAGSIGIDNVQKRWCIDHVTCNILNDMKPLPLGNTYLVYVCCMCVVVWTLILPLETTTKPYGRERGRFVRHRWQSPSMIFFLCNWDYFFWILRFKRKTLIFGRKLDAY